ncbi:unnamed protein product [Candida verbasci]|uniref:Protein YTP1-like C-terminal domain-containing protein n=1 Tax=Candida verbasci TaxID=1227364 RepID=A0A9W4TTT5_9ASCO|nr:unnamed protein product [Candida verbasci]
MEDMDMDDLPEFHPINPGSKTFHWILSIILLVLFPTISSTFSIANRFNWSLILQYISTIYSIFETLFIKFPDPNGHENITSRGTSWSLSILLSLTIFLGTFINGSNLIINKFYSNLNHFHESSWLSKLYKSFSILSALNGSIRVVMAASALLGFCYNDHAGQCAAHFIMGGSFILYSLILSIVLVVPWIRKHSYIQEFYDSIVMLLFGLVNTFTEHRWGQNWSMSDFQHTSFGLIWLCGGMLGVYFSVKRRNWIPSILLICTGYAMSQHSQHLEISTKVHAVFGFALMTAGITRIIEISFLLKDKSSSSGIFSFQYLPPFCLTLSGILFMGANEEQLVLVHDLGSDHSAYVMILGSSAFLIFLYFQLLIQLYLRLVGYNEDGELHKYDQLNAQDFELNDLEIDSE